MWPAWLGCRNSCRMADPGTEMCISPLFGCHVFGGAASKRLLITECSRWRTSFRVCFACSKGLLKVQFPLKNLLALARLPSWHGCVTGLP